MNTFVINVSDTTNLLIVFNAIWITKCDLCVNKSINFKKTDSSLTPGNKNESVEQRWYKTISSSYNLS